MDVLSQPNAPNWFLDTFSYGSYLLLPRKLFARANPEHAPGEMLVCLCPLTLPNWLGVGARAVERRGRERRRAR